MVVSATEWAASASIAEDPLSRPAASFTTPMPALAASAISTVLRLSEAIGSRMPSAACSYTGPT